MLKYTVPMNDLSRVVYPLCALGVVITLNLWSAHERPVEGRLSTDRDAKNVILTLNCSNFMAVMVKIP